MENLTARLKSAYKTAFEWDEDQELQGLCLSVVPHEVFYPDVSCDGDDEPILDAALLARLSKWFKGYMTWVNAPPCPSCPGSTVSSVGMAGPSTQEEIEGKASRVEIYTCGSCNDTVRFPRFNQPSAILTSRRGRCGEYANLFGCICRAVGFDTRYILDFTDHVWIEAWIVSESRWVMADGCEGQIDEPWMYEKGWGKKLSVMVAASRGCGLADVTRRYTRKFDSEEFQKRRHAALQGLSEEVFEFLISDVNSSYVTDRLREVGESSMHDNGALQERLIFEQMYLKNVSQKTTWDDVIKERRMREERQITGGDKEEVSEEMEASISEENLEEKGKSVSESKDGTGGRTSGALEWRAARGELGESISEEKLEEKGEPVSRPTDGTDGRTSGSSTRGELGEKSADVKKVNPWA